MAPRALARTARVHWVGAALIATTVVLAGAVYSIATSQSGATAHPLRNLLVTGALALLLGAAYAVVRLLLQGRHRTADSLTQRFGVPVVAVVPSSATLGRGSVRGGQGGAAVTQEDPVALDAFRTLHGTLASPVDGAPHTAVVVTSPEPRDGRSTVAVHLALTAAVRGERVVLVDADLRHPSVGTRFGVIEGVGLTDVLGARVSVEDVLQPTAAHDNLQVLAAGSVTADAGPLLGSEAMRVLVEHLAQDAFVVLDAPPLLLTPEGDHPSTGAAELAVAAGHALLVVSAGDTRDRALESALRRLRSAGQRASGLVVNRAGRSSPAYRPVG